MFTKQKVLLLGNDSLINEIESLLRDRKYLKTYDLSVMKNYSEKSGTVCIDGSESLKSLLSIIRENKFDTVVVSHRLENFPVLRKQLLEIKFANVTIYDSLYFYEALTEKAPIHYAKDEWFLFRNQGEKFNPPLYKIAKRCMDIFLSLVGIIASLPFVLLIALVIKVSSKGPVFFKQERLGLHERPFTLLKFRTMINDAEKVTGPTWADKNDPRITKVGKLLRKIRFDELPQLFNVLKGEMSFIGTRPIRKYFAEKLAKDIPHYRLRFLIKPGLTGWAQVQGGYFGTEEGQVEKLEYDLYYIQNQSIFFDILIVLKTISTVLFQRGQ